MQAETPPFDAVLVDQQNIINNNNNELKEDSNPVPVHTATFEEQIIDQPIPSHTNTNRYESCYDLTDDPIIEVDDQVQLIDQEGTNSKGFCFFDCDISFQALLACIFLILLAAPLVYIVIVLFVYHKI